MAVVVKVVGNVGISGGGIVESRGPRWRRR